MVNVSGGASVSMNRLIKLVGELAGKAVVVEKEGAQPGDVKRTVEPPTGPAGARLVPQAQHLVGDGGADRLAPRQADLKRQARVTALFTCSPIQGYVFAIPSRSVVGADQPSDSIRAWLKFRD